MVPENLEIECFHSNVLIPFLFKTPIPMIHGLIPPPKHTAILLLWFSQHDEGQGYVLMNMEFLKSCQFTVCLYENETLHKVDPEPDEYRQWRTQGVGVGDLVISVINISQCAAAAVPSQR